MTHESTLEQLFAPARLGGADLPNRLVMAPMSRNRATFDGVPRDIMAEYYAQRASAGLIVGEASTPSPVGFTYPEIPGLYAPEQVAGWRDVIDAVTAAGGRIFLQIEHGGRIGHPDNNPDGLVPIAPSAVRLPGGLHTPTGHQEAPVPLEMTDADLKSTIEDFVKAARNAVDAGAHGVEVHAANGYLLNQFLSTTANRREDAYGGSVANRVRFPVAVVEAVAAEIGAERTGLRISPGVVQNGVDMPDSEELFAAFLEALAPLGLAYLHVAYADPETTLFKAIRAQWTGTLIANPSLGEEQPVPADGGLSKGLELLDAGADLIAFGRAFLANPDLPRRLRTGSALNAVRTDRPLYGGDREAYTDYPALD